MYYDIYKSGKLVKKDNVLLSPIAFSNELMYVPTCTIELPIEYRDYIDGHGEMKIHINGKVFWGIVTGIDVDIPKATMSVTLTHKVSEWEYRQLAINNAILNSKLNFVYKSEADKVVYSHSHNKKYSKYYTLVASKVQIKQNAYDITEQKLLELGRATCYETKNVANIISVKVKSHNIKQALGTYKVTFIAEGLNAQGVTETAQATVEATVSVKGGDVANRRVDSGLYTMQEQLSDIYHDNNFAYPDWTIDFQDDSKSRTIDYVYSKQNKLEALTETMEHTEDLFWRVNFEDDKRIEIGKFGKKVNHYISQKPTGDYNIRMVGEPKVEYHFDNVINLASVYSDKSDGGMSTLTLREVYNHRGEGGELSKDYRLDNPNCKFPVVILKDNIVSDVNNERYYGKIQEYTDELPKIAPNNIYEYAVLDLDSIAKEGGKVIEGTFATNDLGAFNIEDKKISDTYRSKASFVLYRSAIRKLKHRRRNYSLVVTTEQLPSGLRVGDQIRLIYNLDLLHIDCCSNYMKRQMHQDQWWYITAIDYEIDGTGRETDTLTLSKELILQERDIKESVG